MLAIMGSLRLARNEVAGITPNALFPSRGKKETWSCRGQDASLPGSLSSVK